MQATFTFGLLAISVLCYFMFVRPVLRKRPEFDQFYDLSESFFGRVWAWIKIRWDIALAMVAVIAPEIPQLLTELSVLDLSALIPGEVGKRIAQLLTLLATLSRAFWIRRS